jgi:lipopolysaccharide transport system ATP-binding protein
VKEFRIVAHNLGKRFTRRSHHRPSKGWRQLLRGLWRGAAPQAFWALHDISFSVRPGEILGVIGSNGAGKSTLLGLLSGIHEPSTGTVELDGRLGVLLELGGGFVDDLSGRDNAMLAGVVAGLTRRELRARLDEIVAFAEMSEFLDEPVRTYSTGMRMRLAFSVAIHTHPEILLVDEFLAVGDLSFQARCRARIGELRDAGCSIVVVSHALADVRETCDRVLWLREGAIAALDTPEVVSNLYETEMFERTLRLTPAEPVRPSHGKRKLNSSHQRLGSKEMEITAVRISPGSSLRSGGNLVVEMDYQMKRPVHAPIFGVSISREDGTLCIDTNTESARVLTTRLTATGTISFSVPRLELGAGRYWVNVGVFESQWHHAYDYHWEAYPLFVDGATEHKSILAPACRWQLAARGQTVSDFAARGHTNEKTAR